MNKTLLFLVITYLPFKLCAQIAPDIFQTQTLQHKTRVVILGLAAYREFPKDFPEISRELVAHYLRLHDSPKSFTLRELKNYGYQDRETINVRLSRFYGLNKKDLTLGDLAELDRVIDDLNSIELVIKDEFFKQKRLSPKTIISLLRLEQIVDVTDTGIARAKEIGIAQTKYNGANYLKPRGIRAIEISQWIENYHSQILNPAPTCSHLFR